jgi:8-oxo-dGTP pyrophosphatase MutT (NUDIX family)
MDDLIKQIKEYEPKDERERVDKEVILDFVSKNDNVLVRDNKIAHFTTSGWIVNKDKTKVLMIHHNIYNSWAWVGGHADGDPDLFHVVQKEIEEETGIKKVKLLSDGIFGLNIVTVINHIKRGKQVNAHLHFDIEYLLEADENEPLRIKEDENSKVGWVPVEEIIAKVTEEHMKPIYQRLIERVEKLK